ncbi:MAG: hypothetical protein RQ763_06065 [Sulfurimonas sp.]|uniref:hypothetical protein n=1 Tax=Sulfurimonas sp. TaxID=2022749 RepID=UPI0028CBEF6D|nr:hypothetical protein [Sulfurimonas sp.]MDT8338743.1 hypothetical protein [Sulfurimonas sp.]
MIRQIVNGKTVKTVNVSASIADLATLKTLMAGELETWETKGSGGTPSNPLILNHVGFAVGKKLLGGAVHSQSVFIPHLKATKHFHEVRTAVVGVWDMDFNSATACEYANPYNMKSEA